MTYLKSNSQVAAEMEPVIEYPHAECAIGDLRDAFWDGNAGQALAVAKCVLTNLRDAVWDSEAGQAFT